MKISFEQVKRNIYGSYFGQICTYTGVGRPFRDTVVNEVLNTDNLELLLFSHNRSLLLNSLRNITDEDALAVAELEGLAMAKITDRNDYKIALTDDSYTLVITYESAEIVIFKNKQLYSPGCLLGSYQFLQSRGYALPYMRYSIKELVELGIYKLKQIKSK
jgi:hypothetical protein